MPLLKNSSDERVLVPGLDVSLDGGETIEVTAEQAEQIKSRTLLIDGKPTEHSEMNQVEPELDDETPNSIETVPELDDEDEEN